MRRTRLAMMMLVALAVLTAAWADAGWTLRLRLEPETTHRFALIQTQDVELDLGPVGKQKTGSRSRFEFSQSVLAKNEDGSVVLETTYDRLQSEMALGEVVMNFDTDQESGDAHPLSQLMHLLQGKSFRLTMSDRGDIRNIEGLEVVWDQIGDAMPEDPASRQILEMARQGFGEEAVKVAIEQGSPVLPEDEVTVGDSWSRTFNVANQILGSMQIDTRYTVEGAETKSGRECVRLSVSMEVEAAGDSPLVQQLGDMLSQYGGEVAFEIGGSKGQGTVWIDLARGLAIASEMSQVTEFRLNLKTDAQNPEDSRGMHVFLTQQVGLELLD